MSVARSSSGARGGEGAVSPRGGVNVDTLRRLLGLVQSGKIPDAVDLLEDALAHAGTRTPGQTSTGATGGELTPTRGGGDLSDAARSTIVGLRAQLRINDGLAKETLEGVQAELAKAQRELQAARDEVTECRAAAAAAESALREAHAHGRGQSLNVFTDAVYSSGHRKMPRVEPSSAVLSRAELDAVLAVPLADVHQVAAQFSAPVNPGGVPASSPDAAEVAELRAELAELSAALETAQRERDHAREDALVAEAMAESAKSRQTAAETARAGMEAAVGELQSALAAEVAAHEEDVLVLRAEADGVAGGGKSRYGNVSSITGPTATSLLSHASQRSRAQDAATRARVTALRVDHIRNRSRYLAKLARRNGLDSLEVTMDTGIERAVLAAERELGDDDSEGSSVGLGIDGSGVRRGRGGDVESEDDAGSVDSLVSDLVNEINVEIEHSFKIDERAREVTEAVRVKYSALVAELERRLAETITELARARAQVVVLQTEAPIFGVVSINGRRDIAFQLTEVTEATFAIAFLPPPQGVCTLVVTNHASAGSSLVSAASPAGHAALARSLSRQMSVASSAGGGGASGVGGSSAPGSARLLSPGPGSGASSPSRVMSGPALSTSGPALARQLSVVTDVSTVSDAATVVSGYTEVAVSAVPPPAVTAAAAERARIVAKEKARASKPSLGLTVVNGSSTLHVGVVITSVAEGGPADEAGLVPGDIIVSLAGADVGRLKDFRKAMSEHVRPLAPCPLMVVRGGRADRVWIVPASKFKTLRERGAGERGVDDSDRGDWVDEGEHAEFAKEKLLASLGMSSSASAVFGISPRQ